MTGVQTCALPISKGVLGKSISAFLEDKKIGSKLPEDLLALIKRSDKLRKHIVNNHHDYTSKRGLTLTESKIKRLIKYYKSTGKIADTWKYEPDRISIYLE